MQREETRGRDEAPRRRRTDMSTVGKRLAVDRNMLDFDKFAYRWINDATARIFAKTKQDDWDIITPGGAPIKDDATGMGDAVSVIVGAAPDGSALRAYLCRKPRRLFDEDAKTKQTDLDEQLAQLRQGNDRDGAPQSAYVPSGGIKIA